MPARRKPFSRVSAATSAIAQLGLKRGRFQAAELEDISKPYLTGRRKLLRLEKQRFRRRQINLNVYFKNNLSDITGFHN
jgi:hypothetical protein